jgi:hypothetical protein
MSGRRSNGRGGGQRFVHTLHLRAGGEYRGEDIEVRELREQIAELEERVRLAPEHERARRATRRDWVPPADRPTVSRRSGNDRLLTKQEQQAINRERRGHILVSILLVTMLIGLLNWLAHLLRA